MQVVLTKDVPKLGQRDDLVNVKPGFAMNYLIPEGMAILPTKGILSQTEKRRKERATKLEEALKNADQLIKQLSSVKLLFKRKMGGKKLFGSVTDKDIAMALQEQGKIELPAKMVELKEHLKTLGEHLVTIKLSPDHATKIKVVIETE